LLPFQLLDTNIVMVLNQPALDMSNPLGLFQSEEFESIFRPAIGYSQGLILDQQRGPATTHQFESMASQKIVTISNFRLEVHDRSGQGDKIGQNDLPILVLKTAEALGIHTIQALGVNYELQFRTEGTAAAALAAKALAPVDGFMPEGARVRGGSARFLFGEDNGPLYTLSIEPRQQDLTTNVVWVAANYNATMGEIPGVEELKAIHGRGYDTIKNFIELLFN